MQNYATSHFQNEAWRDLLVWRNNAYGLLFTLRESCSFSLLIINDFVSDCICYGTNGAAFVQALCWRQTVLWSPSSLCSPYRVYGGMFNLVYMVLSYSKRGPWERGWRIFCLFVCSFSWSLTKDHSWTKKGFVLFARLNILVIIFHVNS